GATSLPMLSGPLASSPLGASRMPDIGAMLWPRTVALIGASAVADTLRGRILQVLRAHPFAGKLYPISRSHAQVADLKAYPSIADLPQPADLAVIIIPA